MEKFIILGKKRQKEQETAGHICLLSTSREREREKEKEREMNGAS